MAAMEPAGPNAEQIKYWNEHGTKWVRLQEFLDAQIGPLGLRAMQRAGLAAGQHVLDVGCGCGATSVELGRRITPDGSVTAVDISTPMLERAQQRARAAGVGNIRFENADAQTHAFAPGSVDVAFSRFGVMFFADPTAAFANLGRALRRGGRVTFVCWRALQDNPWMFVPAMAAAQHIAFPPLPAPGAPGPFAFADAERVRGILAGAGLVDITLEALDETLAIGGGDLDHTVEFLLQIGPTGMAMRNADSGAAVKVTGAVREALLPYQTPDGVRMPSAAWVVSAMKP